MTWNNSTGERSHRHLVFWSLSLFLLTLASAIVKAMGSTGNEKPQSGECVLTATAVSVDVFVKEDR